MTNRKMVKTTTGPRELRMALRFRFLNSLA